ncbi:hypothetical protein SAMN05444398_101430 [Roseovarius pacificus]|uniref:DUF192 domain-containing protein n=1 Tax=Roseovarius pacificus TaxID=337701 RepID=A0A1M6XHN9_9RHOB|nr:DUF192 domain-containing protein [Roseovarius pacificus]GGO52135.1 hypothetical protein GCM10011315_06960 [Roseovarius pacificus]SHL05456.1 hypothetical protein SAMN05444398_101430 [Roseovarius pacificus]
MGNGCEKVLGLGLASCFFWLASVFAALAGECRDDRVALRGDWGQAGFTVEVADDAEERAQGLMHREQMAKSAGMLFVYPAPRSVGFWMKNTLIELDMIFADRTGTVRRVHHRAQPHDERPIMGGRDIQYVLEINGGLARQLGISEGSQMQHPSIDAQVAAWPC